MCPGPGRASVFLFCLRWFQSVDCDSFSCGCEETVRQLVLEQQRGVAIHCGDNGLFENKTSLPSCILKGTYVCLSLLLSTASTTVAETKETLLLVCRGEESLAVRHAWYDDSFHSNALVWFLCKHGYEKCFLGGRSLWWRQKHDISPSKKREREKNWLKFLQDKPNSAPRPLSTPTSESHSFPSSIENRCF